jgi:hypothetical protein
MYVVKPGTKEGTYDHVSVNCRIGDFGISVFHRPGWHYRSEAPSLKQREIVGRKRVRVPTALQVAVLQDFPVLIQEQVSVVVKHRLLRPQALAWGR